MFFPPALLTGAKYRVIKLSLFMPPVGTWGAQTLLPKTRRGPGGAAHELPSRASWPRAGPATDSRDEGPTPPQAPGLGSQAQALPWPGRRQGVWGGPHHVFLQSIRQAAPLRDQHSLMSTTRQTRTPVEEQNRCQTAIFRSPRAVHFGEPGPRALAERKAP